VWLVACTPLAPALVSEGAQVVRASDGGVEAGPGAGVTPSVQFLARLADGGATPVTSLLYSLPFSIRLEGAPPRARVTLRTRVQRLGASAVFQASDVGVVDTAEHAPVSGSYEGVDAEGLIWSMTPTSSSLGTTFDVAVEAEFGDELVTARLARPGMGTGTARREVMAGGLRGQLLEFADRRPAVLVLGGSECNLDTTAFTAAWVTTAGYHALAVDYCEQRLIEQVPLEALIGALEWLSQRPSVDPTRLAVMGGSRGGELALQLAAVEPRLKAVVAIVPSPWRWGGTGPDDVPAWTFRGADLPIISFAPGAMGSVERLPGGGQGVRFAPAFEASLAAATPAQRAAAAIAIGPAPASFLLAGGADDGVWPSCRFVDDAWAMLTAARHQDTHPLDRRLCFPDTGHALGAPGWATVGGSTAPDPRVGTLVLGGTTTGRGRAQRTFDAAWRAFLAAAFAP
jgi:acetyl esterase/lipase